MVEYQCAHLLTCSEFSRLGNIPSEYSFSVFEDVELITYNVSKVYYVSESDYTLINHFGLFKARSVIRLNDIDENILYYDKYYISCTPLKTDDVSVELFSVLQKCGIFCVTVRVIDSDHCVNSQIPSDGVNSQIRTVPAEFEIPS